MTVAPHLLTQAALNLIVNAGESIPASRRQRRGRIRLWARSTSDGRAVRLGVTDNGRGMTRHVQRHAFDPFFTTKARSMGTGLGLPLVRKVAERAGGKVELTSAPGKGTTVALVLPTSGPATGSTPARRVAAVSVRDRRTGALISQILHEAGLTITPDNGDSPRQSDIWVTEPTDRRLRLARPWRAHAPGRSVILAGAPAPRARRAWEELGATVVEPAHDFEAMRDAVARAASTASTRTLRKDGAARAASAAPPRALLK